MTKKLGVVALARPENGGTYQYTLSTLSALQHLTGFDITLYANPSNPDFLNLGFRVVPFKEPRYRQFIALLAYRMGLKLADPFAAEDVLLAPIYSLSLLHTRKPSAFTLHDVQERNLPDNFSRGQRLWRNQANAALLERASKVLCESVHVKADLISSFGVPAGQVEVVAAPPQRQFRVNLSDDELRVVRERLRLPSRFLFYPAQFWTHKNHLRLIDAFGEVRKQAGDLKLVLTGKARDEYSKVMEHVQAKGLAQDVLHVGFVELHELQAIYQLACTMVMPSLFESISIPIYEAFQVGTPVVASDIPGVSEQVGDAAVLFDPTSVASMKDAILKVVMDPELAQDLVAKGRRRMSLTTPEHYAARLQSLLEGLLRAEA